MPSDFRYLRRKRALAIGADVFERDEHYSPQQFVAGIDEVAHGSLSSLQRALEDASGGRYFAGAAEPEEFAVVRLVVTPTSERDPYMFPSVSLDLVGSRQLRIEVVVGASGPEDDRHDVIRDVVAGFCGVRASDLVDTFSYENDDYMIHHVTLCLARRGATVGDAYDEARSVYELCQTLDAAGFSSRELIKSALRGGRADLLAGQYETAELECKRQA